MEIRGEKKMVPKLRLMAIFASDEGLELLANAKELAMDGTFDSSPKPFKQIFVIQVGVYYCDCYYYLSTVPVSLYDAEGRLLCKRCNPTIV